MRVCDQEIAVPRQRSNAVGEDGTGRGMHAQRFECPGTLVVASGFVREVLAHLRPAIACIVPCAGRRSVPRLGDGFRGGHARIRHGQGVRHA